MLRAFDQPSNVIVVSRNERVLSDSEQRDEVLATNTRPKLTLKQLSMGFIILFLQITVTTSILQEVPPPTYSSAVECELIRTPDHFPTTFTASPEHTATDFSTLQVDENGHA